MQAFQTLRHLMLPPGSQASPGLLFARMGVLLISSPVASGEPMELARTPLCGSAIAASSIWLKASHGNFTSCVQQCHLLRPFELKDARSLRESVPGEARQVAKSISVGPTSYGRSTARRRRCVYAVLTG